ncbi:class I adenylate-forming enzyme family protein [Lysobacter hankyongensis]|uniref:Long-chain fatty acid--CoA ligase n=1 Tax=Lysobacter hankyongensis TaxID=1176535 RepID=A0ABP9BXX9_9GAMM
MSSVPARVAEVVERHPERIAIVADDRRIRYDEFWRESVCFARALRAHGLQPGERVAILLPNRIEAAVACYGCWLAGGIAVPLNVQARARDFQAWLRHAEARHVVHEYSHNDVVDAIAAVDASSGHPPMRRWPVGADRPLCAPAGDDAPEIVRDASDIDADRVAMILYTSGTTGAPKGVTLTHGNLLANAGAVIDYLQLDPDDSVLSILAFYYAYGASVLHTHLLSGACIVLAQNLLFPHLLMDTIVRERITGFSGVPSTFALLLERVKLGDYDLSSLRYLTQAGGPMGPTLTQRLRAALPGARLFVMYGQTEATSRLTWLPPERLDEKLGSVGIPIGGVSLRIVREHGGDADTGEDGEVWVRGANVMRGYWNNPESSAAVLRDGWLRTGDMGHLDDDGYLWLVGRRSDMIKTGAHRVHPVDVEEVIAEVPGVAEVAVVGVDDDVLGQVIKAFVVAPGLPPRSDNLIKAHCRERLASYKIPRDIAFVSALPRTASGKVRRAALLEPDPIP